MANQFKAGDVVTLKSGGPEMTVEQVGDDPVFQRPTVWCVWFEGSKKISDRFGPRGFRTTTVTKEAGRLQ